MADTPAERTYSDDEITRHLADKLPKWRFSEGAISRRYDTNGWKATLMVVNTVGHLAEAAWHHPDISASYNRVEVRLSTHSAKGITDKDFELAAKLDEVVLWRPGAEGGALEGTPADPSFAYVKYD